MMLSLYTALDCTHGRGLSDG